MNIPPFEAGWKAFVNGCEKIRGGSRYCQSQTKYEDDYVVFAKDCVDNHPDADEILELYRAFVVAQITGRLKA